MAWTTPRTWTASELVTAAIMNAHVRDNLNATAPAIVTTKGDIVAGTGANTIARVPVGATLGNPLVANSACSAGVAFDSTISVSACSVGVGFGASSLVAGTFQVKTGTNQNLVFRSGSIAFVGASCVMMEGINDGGTSVCPIGFWGACYIFNSANWFLGDTANSFQTGGITINQGAADDEILSMKSSDVAHGITTDTETDTYLLIKKSTGTTGGGLVGGYTEDSIGLALVGNITNGTTAKNVAGYGAVHLIGQKKSGTTVAPPAANENLVSISDGVNVHFIFDVDGDFLADAAVTASAFDRYDDAAMCRAIDVAISQPDTLIEDRFKDWTQYGREHLQAAGLVHFNADGHHFVNYTKLSRLHTGAIWQQETKLRKQAEVVRDLSAEIQEQRRELATLRETVKLLTAGDKP